MTLSDEERQRIYEEEKARREAQEQLAREAKQRQTTQGCLGCLGFLAAVVIVAMIFSAGESPSSRTSSYTPSTSTTRSSTSSPSPATSDPNVMRLSPPGGGAAYVAIDEKSFDQLIKAAVAKDDVGIVELIAAGRVFTVSTPVTVRLLDAGFTKARVRILEGPRMNSAGWVPAEWVK